VAPSVCAWTANTTAGWAVITSGAAGTGSGVITVESHYNSTGATQLANLNVVGTQSTAIASITQPAGTCTYSLDKPSYAVGAAGGAVSANLTAATGCPWTVTNNYPLAISFTSASSGTGTGTPSTISMNVAPNLTGNPQNFTLAVGTTSIQIAQAFGAPPAIAITSGGGGANGNYGAWSVGDVQTALTATGGIPPYTWSISSGSLPAGLYIRTDTPTFFPPDAYAGIIGVATGTPGVSNFTLKVTDSTGSFMTQAASLTVTGLTITDLYNLPDGFTNVNYSWTLNAAGAAGSVTWALANGSTLPPGLSLNGGVIS